MEQLALRPTAAAGRGRLPSSCAAAFIDSSSESQSERGKREDLTGENAVAEMALNSSSLPRTQGTCRGKGRDHGISKQSGTEAIHLLPQRKKQTSFPVATVPC